MNLADSDNTFDLDPHVEAEAALEALRAAIGQGQEGDYNHALETEHDVGDESQHNQHPQLDEHIDPSLHDTHTHTHHEEGQGQATHIHSQTLQQAQNDNNQLQLQQDDDVPPPMLVPASQVQVQSAEKALSTLNQLSNNSNTILDSMNIPQMMTGMAGSLKLLVDSQKRQAEIVKSLVGRVHGTGPTGGCRKILFSPSEIPRFGPRLTDSRFRGRPRSRFRSVRSQNRI